MYLFVSYSLFGKLDTYPNVTSRTAWHHFFLLFDLLQTNTLYERFKKQKFVKLWVFRMGNRKQIHVLLRCTAKSFDFGIWASMFMTINKNVDKLKLQNHSVSCPHVQKRENNLPLKSKFSQQLPWLLHVLTCKKYLATMWPNLLGLLEPRVSWSRALWYLTPRLNRAQS